MRVYIWQIPGRGWWHQIDDAGVHVARQGKWGPYKDIGLAKRAVRQRFRNRAADGFVYVYTAPPEAAA